MTAGLGDSRQAMEAGDCRYQFRIALLGDAAVGKTSLLRRYVEGGPGTPEPEPELESAPTVGVEFYSRALQLRAGPRVKLQLWDTAGQERFRCLVGQGAEGVSWTRKGRKCEGPWVWDQHRSTGPWESPRTSLNGQSRGVGDPALGVRSSTLKPFNLQIQLVGQAPVPDA